MTPDEPCPDCGSTRHRACQAQPSPSGMTIAELHKRIEGLEQIPATEQCIGHFQMAVKTLLQDMAEEIAKLQTAVGIYRG